MTKQHINLYTFVRHLLSADRNVCSSVKLPQIPMKNKVLTLQSFRAHQITLCLRPPPSPHWQGLSTVQGTCRSGRLVSTVLSRHQRVLMKGKNKGHKRCQMANRFGCREIVFLSETKQSIRCWKFCWPGKKTSNLLT